MSAADNPDQAGSSLSPTASDPGPVVVSDSDSADSTARAIVAPEALPEPHRHPEPESEPEPEFDSILEEEGGGPVKTFLEHLEDLRWTLIKCVVSALLAMLVALSAANYVVAFLKWPLDQAQMR